MSAIFQVSDNGPVMLITIEQSNGDFCGYRILFSGPQAGREVSATKRCKSREEAMTIMMGNPPILTTASGGSAPQNLRVYKAQS